MFKKIFQRHKLTVSIISCGDTGQNLGGEMIQSLKEHGASIKSLAITSEMERHPKSKLFNRHVSIDNLHDGFAKRFKDGYQAAKGKMEEINEMLEKVVPDDDEDSLILITTGAGATGLGSTLVVLDLLYKNYKMIPPVFTLMPESFENSRVQYNISIFLYRVVFKIGNYGNSVLLIDNKPTISEMDNPFSTVSQRRVDIMPNALADLLYASFEEPLSEEFNASVSDLFEVMHTPGIAVFISEDLQKGEEGQIDTARIEDVISESVITTTSLSKEEIFQAKHAFISLFNLEDEEEKLSFQTEFEARKLYQKFTETHPFVKIVNQQNDDQKAIPKVRGIISGLPLPNRILQIMRVARDSRKRIIKREVNINSEVIPIDEERMIALEEKLRG